MRKFDTKVQHLKYKVLREVAREAWKGTLLDNILDIQIPKTPATQKYTQTDEKVSINSKMIGSRRLAIAFNNLANMVTGSTNDVEKF